MYNTDFLYETFLSMLFDMDSKHHSCLTDLVFLKDYRKIKNSKLEDEDECDDVKATYVSLYKHHVEAEKMKRYIEQNKIKCYAINEWDLFIELKNGDKFVYDSYHNTVIFNLHKINELTEEQEIKEFARNLCRLINRNGMTQQEFAKSIGVSRVTVNRYMNGKQIPDYLTLSKMARALKCSVDDFYYKEY